MRIKRVIVIFFRPCAPTEGEAVEMTQGASCSPPQNSVQFLFHHCLSSPHKNSRFTPPPRVSCLHRPGTSPEGFFTSLRPGSLNAPDA